MNTRHFRYRLLSFCMFAVVLFGCQESTFAEWGHLKGQVVFEGEIPERKVIVEKGQAKKNPKCCAAKEAILSEELVIDPKTKGIANCVIFLRKKPDIIHPDLLRLNTKEIDVEIENCTFKPHVLVVQKNQKVRILNHDGCGHNPRDSGNRTCLAGVRLLGPYDNEKGLTIDFKFADLLPRKVECSIHPWMNAYWYVVDHPYAIVTDKDGKFEIKNLPVGTHDFTVWQEKSGYLEKRLAVTIEDNQTSTVTVKADKDDFK